MALGGPEVAVIVIIGLLLFGPKKLPELARAVGRAVGEYQKAVREFENEADKVRKDVLEEKPQPSAITPSRTKTSGPSPQLKKIAKNLGIDPAGKSEAQLLAEINRKTKLAEKKLAEKESAKTPSKEKETGSKTEAMESASKT
ncbi:MAG: twin-arginine translocase TatA/TatE family subunit [Candidatus Hydrothermarchaeales archaeon]